MKWKLFAAVLSLLLVPGLSFLSAQAASVPATVTATPSVTVLSEQAYRWYANIDGLDPTIPLAVEGTATDTPDINSQIRLRMSVANLGGATFAAGGMFTLQYANATSGPWTDVSTSTAWAFLDNPSVADGQVIVTLLLGSSTVGESYGESNPSAATPTALLSGDFGEWDWALVNLSATTSAAWFFRMVNSGGAALNSYASYPKLSAVAPSSGGGGPPSNPQPGGGGGGSPYATSTFPIAPPLLPPAFQVADFNGDNRVDIIDLSILLYYYDECGSGISRFDLNHSGCVDFPDVSILMYRWTG